MTKEEKMGIPQIIYIALMASSLGIYAAHHGESRSGEKYNFFTALISVTIQMLLLWWGGFFNG